MPRIFPFKGSDLADVHLLPFPLLSPSLIHDSRVAAPALNLRQPGRWAKGRGTKEKKVSGTWWHSHWASPVLPEEENEKERERHLCFRTVFPSRLFIRAPWGTLLDVFLIPFLSNKFIYTDILYIRTVLST